MKFELTENGNGVTGSLPAWGEWIEMGITVIRWPAIASLSPHGESGLKFELTENGNGVTGSLPAWGEWIEIEIKEYYRGIDGKSLPAWGEWIEIADLALTLKHAESLPAWGEWIEIESPGYTDGEMFVSPRMGRVD